MKRIRNALLMTLILIFCFAAPISALTIGSPSGIVIDAQDGGPLYSKNADVLRSCASTTKIMSLLLIFDDIKAGKITLDTRIPISAYVHQASLVSGWSNVPLREGQTYSVRELVESICVNSACASTMAMAEYLGGTRENFIARMNARGSELGLTAQYADETGLSSSCKITARSLAKLSDYLIDQHPEILGFTALTATVIDGKTYYATNELLPGKAYTYLGADGLKTGSTTPAGKCFVGTAQRNGTRIIMVVLGASSINQRYTDAVNMLDFGFNTAPLYPLAFKDVASTAWYYGAVETGYQNGLVSGTGTYTYEPDSSVTRAMFVTVLGRIWEKSNGAIADSGRSRFPDVAIGSWYQKYVDWADSNSIAIGFEDSTFRPDESIPREQMMTILHNYNEYINGDVTDAIDYEVLNAFTDGGSVSDWAKDGAAWCVEKDIINGMDATHLMPNATANRAQMVTVFVGYTSKN